MLSKNTYAVWNLLVGILAVLMTLNSFQSDNALYVSIGFGAIAVVFFVFSGMAYLGKGIYAKHPVKWKPNGEPEVDE